MEVLSTQWDVYRPAAGGKVIWAELTRSEPVNPPLRGETLPQRGPGSHRPLTDSELERVDLALMQHVSDGLRATLRRNAESFA